MKRRMNNEEQSNITLTKKEIHQKEAKKRKSKAEQKKHLKHLYGEVHLSILDMIPFKSEVNSGDLGFEYCSDRGFFDIYKCISFDYMSANDELLILHIYTWDKFYRVSAENLKLISINLPLDLTDQIRYYKKKYKETTNPMYKQTLKETLNELKNELRYRQTKEFYLCIYAKSFDNLQKIQARVHNILISSGLVSEITYDEKKKVFNKFSNPYNFD